MKTTTRAEAKVSGLQRYFTGKACRNRHYSQRYTSNGHCLECADDHRAVRVRNHPLLDTWYNMVARCTNENAGGYSDYGGRGISVCERWLCPEEGYENFVADMGPRPDGFTLDRVDYDRGYEPSNCRWADSVTQARNRRSTKLKGEDVIAIFHMIDAGERQCDIAARFRCARCTISNLKRKRAKYIEAGLDCRPKAA